MRHIQPQLEGVVVGVREPGVGFTFEGGELPGNVSEVSGEVLDLDEAERRKLADAFTYRQDEQFTPEWLGEES